MVRRRIRRRPYSLMSSIKVLSALAIPIILVNIVIGIVSITNVSQENANAITTAFNVYKDSLNARQRAIERFVRYSVVNDILMSGMEEAQDFTEQATALTAFRNRVTDSQYATGTEFNYYLCLKEQDMFYNVSELRISYAEFTTLKNFMMDEMESGSAASHNETWRFVVLDGKTYMYYMVDYYNRFFATFVNMEDIAEPLLDLNTGESGGIVLTDKDENVLYSSNPTLDVEASHRGGFLNNWFTFAAQDTGLPFHVLLRLDAVRNYAGIMLAQMVVVVGALCICLSIAAYLFYMYRRVIKPIHEFSKNLENINEQGEVLDLHDSNITELMSASMQFRNLIREVRKLKINIYEQELEKKRFEITFLQNQIRPHFFLNCLTTISSLATLGDSETIQSMVLFTSRYLRYLFQTDKEYVLLMYELAHIQAYMDIQAIRYGPVFSYRYEVPDLCQNALIPPLLLITFAENCIKHNNMQEEPLQIYLCGRQEFLNEKECLYISIRDTGQGFPQEVLDKLNHGEEITVSENGHIGIMNNIQRLSLLYGTEYRISFYNEPFGGARIDLWIPYRTQEKGTTDECIAS